MSGHSQKGYVKSLVRHLSEEHGFIVGVVHNRGVKQPFTSPVFPDIASSTEIETIL
jgi:predicted alpha/beta-fold hydrolase